MPSQLFTSFRLRDLDFRNRLFVSPMCQYSATDGVPGDWHLVHLGSRAVGGAGLVMAEAAAVSPEGRISPADLGIWNDTQRDALTQIARFIKDRGAVPAIQLAHAGRKASTTPPWQGSKKVPPAAGGWQVVAPSAIAFSPDYPQPRALDIEEFDQIEADFLAAAERAQAAGFEVIEIHMAHGYLLHEFLSPISNRRADAFGGSLENRMRFPLRVAQSLREYWPDNQPVFVRISATDWVAGGWDLEQSIDFARRLKAVGIDLIDCSSGGNVPDAKIPAGPGYQTPFATAIREEAGIATGAVGMIADPFQAEHVIATGLADAVFMARELLRDPYWPLHAAEALHAEIEWPVQYLRARTR